MISTKGIFSTGLKKCRPMNFVWSGTAVARPVMGKVEVLEAITASAPTTACAAAETLAFRARSSQTASTLRSQQAKSAQLTVAGQYGSESWWERLCPYVLVQGDAIYLQ